MNMNLWNTIEQIFYRAFEVPEDRRSDLIRELSGGNSAIEDEVLSLLEHYRDDEHWIQEDSVVQLRDAVQSTVELLRERQAGPANSKIVAERSLARKENDPSDELWAMEALESHGDRFRFEQVLGRGGMGMVVRAFDRALQRRVAVKIVHSSQSSVQPNLMGNRHHHRKFLQESRIIAQLHSDHIVGIYEVIENEATPCLVMEWIRGPSIRKMIDARGRIAPRMAAEITRQVAMGLAQAHLAKQTHRDIKPSNILLQRRIGRQTPWRAKIVDFGLARSMEVNPDQTQENALLGTPTYMSPEQILADGRVDLRSDIYSLGVTLYEMLVGEPPFRGSPHMLIRQIESAEPKMLREWDDRIPKDLESICMKAMSKDPSKRYSSADEFALDLGRFLEGRPTVARPVSNFERWVRWSKRNPSLAGSLAIAASLLTILFAGSILSAALLYQKNRQVTLAQSRADQVLLERLSSADPAFVAGAIDQIEIQIADRIPPLLRLFEEQTDVQGKLNLASALTAVGHSMHGYMLDHLEKAPTEVGQCQAYVRAFSKQPEYSRSLIADRYERSTSVNERVKLSMIALHLGDPKWAMLSTDATRNPDERTVWIHQLPTWHGHLKDLIQHAQGSKDERLVSAILLGLGLMEKANWSQSDQQSLDSHLSTWLKSDRSVIRGAAKWLATTLPTMEKGTSRKGPDSHVLVEKSGEVKGFDMILIEPGSFQMGNEDPSLQYAGRTAHEVRLTRRYRIADREVSVEEYRRFLDDVAYPDEAKPKEYRTWSMDDVVSPTPQHPVQSVTWSEAVLYCNWLSLREGLKPAYTSNGKQTIVGGDGKVMEYDDWVRVEGADGYRLPSEAEFEYACRAGTQTSYFFGNDRSYLHYYGGWSNNSRVSAGKVGSHLPNPWGLFEMHGNVWEWSDDWHREFPAEAETDPRGEQPHPEGKAFRGGGICTFSGDPVSCSRGRARPDVRYLNLGFRVARD